MTSPDTCGPSKVVLASFESNEAAQHAVDILARHKFPVEHVTIVGTGLRWQEQVIGRLTLPRALLAGAATGGWIGLLIGLVFWIVMPWASWALLSGIVLGWVLGAVWAAIAYAVRRRAFAAVPAVVADRYDLLVDAEFAAEARRILTTALPAALRSS
jgi:tetrahydromethanopterin S-methyltransferase subunit F